MADQLHHRSSIINVRQTIEFCAEALEFCFDALCTGSWTCHEAEQLYLVLEMFGLEADHFMWCHAMTDDEDDLHKPVKFPAQWAYRNEGENNAS